MSGPTAGLARATIRGTIWMYASFVSGKLLVFVSTVVLARLLTKEDFGIVGYALTVISFLDVFKDLGVGAAIVYYGADAEAPNTAFWLNLVVSGALFGATWLLSPWIGAFFGDARAVPVTQMLALVFPINALGNIHENLLARDLAFRRRFFPGLAQSLSKGGLSIILAWSGVGYWSLIWGQIGGEAVATLAMWLVSPWRPQLQLHWRALRRLVSYGLNTVWGQLAAVLVANWDYLMIGRYLGPESLGVYSLAFRFSDLLVLQFNSVISRVIFPVFTRLNGDADQLRQGFLQATRYIVLVNMALGLGVALLAEPFVLTFYTDKWLEAIPVLQLIALTHLALSLAWHAGDIYRAQGRPDLVTGLLLARLALLLPALWWAAAWGQSVVTVAWMQLAVAAAAAGLNLGLAMRRLHIPLAAVAAALRPAVLSGAVMAAAVGATLLLLRGLLPLPQLLIGTVVGAGAYGAALWWGQPELAREATQRLRTALGRG